MSPAQLAETAAISLQHGQADHVALTLRRDLRDYWARALTDAGFRGVPGRDYLRLLAFAEAKAGLRVLA